MFKKKKRNLDEIGLGLVWWFMGWGSGYLVAYYVWLSFSKFISVSKMATRALAIAVNRKDEGIQKAYLFHLRAIPKSCTQASAKEAGKT